MTKWGLFDVAYGALWVLVILNTVVLVALVRQVGILLLRVGQVAPARALEGPAEGETLRIPALPTPSQPKRATDAFRRLIVFVSIDCGTCQAIVPAVDAVAKTYPEYHPILVADAEEQEVRRWLRDVRARDVPAVALPGILKELEIPGTPFACVVDDSDNVLASGGVNHLDHIETLIRRCRARADRRLSALTELQEIEALAVAEEVEVRQGGAAYDGKP